MKRILFLLLFFLTACSGQPVMSGLADPQIMASPVLMTPTAAETPTPTVDTQATISVLEIDAQAAQEQARSAQLTSDAANRLLVDATVTHEAMLMLYAQMTQQAEYTVLTHEAMTMQVEQATATAYQTSIPLTQNAQATNDSVIGTVLAITVNAPEIELQLAQADVERRYGGMKYFIQSLTAIGLVVLPIVLLAYLLQTRKPKPMAARDFGKDDDPVINPIPMSPMQDAPNVTKLAEFRCAVEPIIARAHGIHDGKTLAYNQWRGTEVMNALSEIRRVLKMHKLAYELPGKGGELVLAQPLGVDWMEQVHAREELPEPFICNPPLPRVQPYQ